MGGRAARVSEGRNPQSLTSHWRPALSVPNHQTPATTQANSPATLVARRLSPRHGHRDHSRDWRPGQHATQARGSATTHSGSMPLATPPRRDRSILEQVLLLRLLDALRHGGSLRPVGNHGPARSPAGKSVRRLLRSIGESPGKTGRSSFRTKRDHRVSGARH